MAEYRVAQPLRILEASCKRAGLDILFIGEESGHLARVSNGQDFFYAGGAVTPTYPLNNAVAQDLCHDKSYCADLLASAGLTVPRSRLFFPGFGKENIYKISDRGIPDALSYVDAVLTYPVVVKPNRGSMGRGVQVVWNSTDLVIAMQATLEFGHACLVQEFLRGQEYRIFCLDGLPRFMYRKLKPTVAGNGTDSLRELIRSNKALKLEMVLSKGMEEYLLSQSRQFVSESLSGEIWDGIPLEGASISLSGAGNLAIGAQIDGFSTDFHDSIVQLVSQVRDILQVEIYGIDLICSEPITDITGPRDYKLIEVNANPSLSGAWASGHETLCMDIWQDIIKMKFGEL